MWLNTPPEAPRTTIRIRESAPEDSPLRQQILAIVKAQPGIPIGELMSRLGIGWGTVYHHISKLTRAGLIRTHASGRRRLVFPSPFAVEPQDAPAYAIVHGATAQRVARAIVEKPGRSITDLCAELNESARVVYYHVKRLLDAGLVTSSSKTRHNDLRGTQRLEDLLTQLARAAHEPVPPASAKPSLRFRL